MGELKKQKEEKYKELILKQKQIEIDKIKETKRLEKERKIQKLQKQRRLKEIESNKLILSQMHYKRALILYSGWIPWMQRIEQNNLSFHKLAVIRNCNLQKQFWSLWLSVIKMKKNQHLNAMKAACIGREMMSNKLFAIKVETKYWSFWSEIILKYKMMSAVILEKQKANMLKIYLSHWRLRYEYNQNQKQLKQRKIEDTAIERGKILIMRRIMKSWKATAVNVRKEKIKARTWRKVEVWLTELRANR